MGVFAYTRKTFVSVLNDVIISYYTHRLNAQALWNIDKSFFEDESDSNISSISSHQPSQSDSNNSDDKIKTEDVNYIVFKLSLESIKETIFAYTLPIFHIVKLPIFLTVAAFSEVFTGLKADFNYFFKRNRSNSQDNTDNIVNEEDSNNPQMAIDVEDKDYYLNESIENYFKPQSITVDFSRAKKHINWPGTVDTAKKQLNWEGLDIYYLRHVTNKKELKI